MTSIQGFVYLFMRKLAQQLNSVIYLVLLYQLLQHVHLLTITSDDEIYVFELFDDVWNYSNEKVDTFSIRKSGNINKINSVFICPQDSSSSQRSKSLKIDCIWNCKATVWVKFGSQAEVVLACMANCYSSIKVPKYPLQNLIQIDRSHVLKVEE